MNYYQIIYLYLYSTLVLYFHWLAIFTKKVKKNDFFLN